MTGEGVIAERRLIINADDLGLSPAVNRGILEAHAAGTVTSASLLANAPGLSDAVARLRDVPTLQVGLHLNLTAGSPVAPAEDVASLCDRRTQRFHSLRRQVARALTGRILAQHVAAECTAQLERVRQLGVSVRHIDSHHHVHALPIVWNSVLEVARRAGVHAVRLPRESSPRGSMRLGRALLALSLRAAWRVASNGHIDANGVGRADRFWGFGLSGTRDFQRRLLALFDRLEPGSTELMVHPGYVDHDLIAWDPYTTGRERELTALCSREVRDRLARGDIRLVA
ncbi:MAG TPA: ChbG/HpnK family deacetylase [Gemmatimonadales bacterium]|nr:ChbG/HpnK family deacetylase [Gemmatimonadales bacterium]